MNERKRKYDQDYHRLNLKRIVFNLNKETDKDIISYLEKQTNVQGTLKSLIRERIKKEND